MTDALFDVNVNPMGTLYNPASIASAYNDILQCRAFTAQDLFDYQGRFHSFSHHSSFSGVNKEQVLSHINDAMKEAHEHLVRTSVVIVTFGTAYVYEKDGEVVSNCHKLPASTFVRRRLEVDKIVAEWRKIVAASDKRFIFTVSPIRHLADGAHDNQLSKSILLLAVEKICGNSDNAVYFPSYEIMMDDLRDYRFYASDMSHPSQVAVDYIYQHFQETYFHAQTIDIASRSEKLSRRLEHRFMTDDEVAIQKFKANTQTQIEELKKLFPYLERAINKKTQEK